MLFVKQLWFWGTLGREVCTEGQYTVHFPNSLGLRGGDLSVQSDVASVELPGDDGIPGDCLDLARNSIFKKTPSLSLPHFAKWLCGSPSCWTRGLGVLDSPPPLIHGQAPSIS